MFSLANHHFEIFGLPISFEIDRDLLNQRYRELQRTVHPDNYANASDKERRLAVQKAAQINEAFNVLKEPLKRAQYLLELQGIDTKEVELSSDFLMEQMELREQLASITKMEELTHFLGHIEDNIQDLVEQFAHHSIQQKWITARYVFYQLQFFNRLRQETLNLEEQLTID